MRNWFAGRPRKAASATEGLSVSSKYLLEREALWFLLYHQSGALAEDGREFGAPSRPYVRADAWLAEESNQSKELGV